MERTNSARGAKIKWAKIKWSENLNEAKFEKSMVIKPDDGELCVGMPLVE